MDEKDLINFAIKVDTITNLRKAYQVYGIEGTEEKIKDLYKYSPVLMKHLLNFHYLILNKEDNLL